MKKFIAKILLFAVIVFAPFLALNALYSNTTAIYTLDEMYFIKHHPTDIELITLGNSHAAAGFRMEENFEGVSHNFATSSQNFYYSYQVLVSVADDLAENATVIVPVSLFDWHYDMDKVYVDSLPATNTRYYRVLSPTQIYNFNIEDYFYEKVFPILSSGENIKYIWEDVAPPPTQDPVETTVVGNVVHTADYKFDSWWNDVMTVSDEVASFNIEYFHKIIEFCHTNNFTPVVVSMPNTAELIGRFPPDYLEYFAQTTAAQVAQYPNLIFLDYTFNEKYNDDLTLFRDSDHLNSIGGDIFTQEILSKLSLALPSQ